MLNLWPVDDLTVGGLLRAAGARMLDHDDRTVTIAIPAERVGDVAVAFDRGDLLTALVPTRAADAGSLRQRTYKARSPSTPRPTTTR